MEINKHANAQTDLICGAWYAKFLGCDGCWLLQREPVVPASPESGWDVQPREYGQWFDFHEDGGFVDAYYAPCGNDALLHRWTGNWEFGEGGRTLILQIENYPVRSKFQMLRPTEAYRKGQEIHIIEITKEQMQLQFKDPVELLWEYAKHNPYSF